MEGRKKVTPKEEICRIIEERLDRPAIFFNRLRREERESVGRNPSSSARRAIPKYRKVVNRRGGSDFGYQEAGSMSDKEKKASFDNGPSATLTP